LERYFSEMEALLTHLEDNVAQYVPSMGTVVLNAITADGLVPPVDIFERVLAQTGTRDALEILKRDGKLDTASLGDTTAAIEREASEIRIDTFMDRIRRELDEVRIDSGVSTDAYQPDKVMARITEIEKDAGVTDAEQAQVVGAR
jgi:hypothetical protein